MTGEQLALDCGPTWTNQDDDEPPHEPRLRDLSGQGPTRPQLRNMETIQLTGSYL